MYSSIKIKIFITVATVSMLLASSTSVFARRINPPSARNGSTASEGNTCFACHVGSSGSGSVQILGAPTVYTAGTVYPLTVRVEDASQVGAGFQISVEDASGNHVGFLVATDFTNTQLNSGWINHTSTGVNNSIANWVSLGNAAEFNVRWEAPPTDEGPITFWAVGNAINDSSTSAGDIIYLTDTTAEFGQDVPTVSQWGILVMLILIMTSATLIMSRKQSESQS